MKTELDELLCKKYPKLFKNRHAPMQETCMCWGFDVGDGWFDIIDQLCGNIQHHIDWRERQVESALKYNEIAMALQSGNPDPFAREFGDKGFSEDFVMKRCKEILDGPLRIVPEGCPQVIVDQVKEKFGTLRFYFTGGNDYIGGLVTMAESMSGVTCEQCSNPAKTGGAGWIHTTCALCTAKREADRAARQ